MIDSLHALSSVKLALAVHDKAPAVVIIANKSKKWKTKPV